MSSPETLVTPEGVRKRLARRVFELNLSGREIGTATGFKHQAVSRYLSGETENVPGVFLARFCLASSTSLVWLFTGRGTASSGNTVSLAESCLGEIEELLERYYEEVEP